MQATTENFPRRVLHGWALVTLVAALPLLFLGAEVTTMGAGMVDAQGLRSPWYFFQELLHDRGLDWRIEHGHRQAGWIIGMCVIVLTALCWLLEPRRSVRWLSILALVAVCGQGLLGIFRIELNALFGKTLALVHGCFAQLVFALMGVLAVVTSRHWESRSSETAPPGLRRWALATLAIVYLQLVLGGLVRHMDFTLLGRAHLLGAFVVLGSVLWLAKLAMDSEPRALAPRWIVLLLFLVGFQILLGIETWLSKFFVPQASWNQLQPLAVHQDFVRSIHYVTGTLIFATTMAVAVMIHRQAPACATMRAAVRPLEGTV